MKIDFYCHPGSPSFRFNAQDIWRRGIGGAELSLISLAEALVNRGHRVRVFREPPHVYAHHSVWWGGVEYLPAVPFYPTEHRDVFILYRNPFPHIEQVRADCKLFWTMDQITTGRYGEDIYPFVDHTVCISEFHREDHIQRYKLSPEQITAIDLGVRLQDYQSEIPKTRGKLIFCAVPHRGLPQLAQVFPRIKERCPWATLHITGDYTLWGRGIAALDGDMRALFEGMDGVFYYGKIPRDDLVEHQLTAELYVYPHWPVSSLPELFGVSVAECMAAGCVPIVSDIGALPSTVGGGGCVVYGDPREEQQQDRFVDLACILLGEDNANDLRIEARIMAKERFDWDVIAERWEEVIDAHSS